MAPRYDLGFTHRPALRLSRVEEILRQTRVIDPVPSRQFLIKLIEDGTLRGRKMGNRYIVDEASFLEWVKSVNPHDYEPIYPKDPPLAALRSR